jgi:sugar phosphate isomerase/epimerase
MNPLGLHAAFARTLPLPERFVLLRDAGFDATALWWEHQREEIRAIRHRAPDLVRSHGLVLDHFHVPYFACNELWCANDSGRRSAIDLHLSWVADCQRHEIPRMVMHVTRGKTPPLPSPAALDAFRELADAAEDAGVVLAVENTHCPAHLDFLFQNIHSPALSLCFDTAHDRLHSPAPLTLLRAWAPRTSVLHLSDTDGRRDWHWLPGDGNTDFAEVAACFPAPFTGPLMLEGMLRGDEAPAAFARRAHEAALAVHDLFQLAPVAASPVR